MSEAEFPLDEGETTRLGPAPEHDVGWNERERIPANGSESRDSPRSSRPSLASLPAPTEEQRYDNPAELAELTTGFVTASRRYLDLVAGNPDLPAYSDGAFIEAVKRLVLGSPHSRVRILLIEPRAVMLNGHALIELALRLTSHMEIRVLTPEFQSEAAGLLIADRRHCLQRFDPRRCSGQAWFDAPRRAMKLLDDFETLWNVGTDDPNFRRLML